MTEPATVTQVSPLMVQLDSSRTPTPAMHLTSYTAAVADRVAVDRQGSQLIVLGAFS